MPRGSPPYSSRPRSRSRSPAAHRRDRGGRDEVKGDGASGGGRYSPRRRSPPPPPPPRSDAGWGGGASGSATGFRESGRGRGDRGDGYSARDREKEREGDRKRYETDSARDMVKREDGDDDSPSIEPEKPNFANSGLLAKESNTVKGVQLKYHEPPEARKPVKNWRLYVFKGKEQIDLIHIYRQSCYLVGRDTVVTDIPIAHPSCSKQHAVIQFRQVTERNEFGDSKSMVKPFIIDLDSTNGTSVNDQEVPKSRYYELRNSDVIKFGTSSREYVLLNEEAGN